MVNELKISAPLSEYKLKIIEGKTESLLQNSSEIYNSLSSIDTRIQLVAQTTKNVGDHIDFILKHSEALYQQSKKLAASQSELQWKEGQVEMRKGSVDGLAMLNDSYNSLGNVYEDEKSANQSGWHSEFDRDFLR